MYRISDIGLGKRRFGPGNASGVQRNTTGGISDIGYIGWSSPALTHHTITHLSLYAFIGKYNYILYSNKYIISNMNFWFFRYFYIFSCERFTLFPWLSSHTRESITSFERQIYIYIDIFEINIHVCVNCAITRNKYIFE